MARAAGSFRRAEFGENVAKWVRPSHVQTDQHWMTSSLTRNQVER